MQRPRSLRSLLAVALAPLFLAFAFTCAVYLATGPSLGLFIGGVFVATLLAPPLVLWRDEMIDGVIVAMSIVDGVAVVWLVAVFTTETTFFEWLAAYVVLAAYVTALEGIVVALRRVRFGDVAASAVTVTLALAWLTWPVWLSPWATQSTVRWLVRVHPLFALNGLLIHLGVWGEGGLAYELTTLGQDVPYHLPATVHRAIVLHMLLGGMLLLLASGHRRTGAAVDVPDGHAR